MFRVIPDKHLVIVLTGGGSLASGLVNEYILPAVKLDAPLPENRQGAAKLESLVRRTAQPPDVEPEAVAPLPAIAELVSGQTYAMERNPFGVRSVSLVMEEEDEAQLHLTTDGSMTGDAEIEWRIGLDGVPRFAAGRFGLPAARKGGWDARTPLSEIDEIGNINVWQLKLQFEDDKMTLTVSRVKLD